MRRLAFGLAAVLATSTPAAVADELDAAWAKYQPSRGVFVLRPAGTGNGAQVSLGGRLVVDQRLTCAELEITTAMELRVTSGSQTMAVTVEQQSRETRDGKVYRFSSRIVDNGREIETREGQAILESRDGPGEAKIKGAAGGEDLKLEAGTMLPTTHSLRVLAAALAGKPVPEHRVFFGFDQMKITLVRTTISGPGRSAKGKGMGEFADKPGWTIRDELREVGSNDAQPQVMESFVTEEGVPTRMSMTVQGIELAATPISIEKLAKPECR